MSRDARAYARAQRQLLAMASSSEEGCDDTSSNGRREFSSKDYSEFLSVYTVSQLEELGIFPAKEDDDQDHVLQMDDSDGDIESSTMSTNQVISNDLVDTNSSSVLVSDTDVVSNTIPEVVTTTKGMTDLVTNVGHHHKGVSAVSVNSNIVSEVVTTTKGMTNLATNVGHHHKGVSAVHVKPLITNDVVIKPVTDVGHHHKGTGNKITKLVPDVVTTTIQTNNVNKFATPSTSGGNGDNFKPSSVFDRRGRKQSRNSGVVNSTVSAPAGRHSSMSSSGTVSSGRSASKSHTPKPGRHSLSGQIGVQTNYISLLENDLAEAKSLIEELKCKVVAQDRLVSGLKTEVTVLKSQVESSLQKHGRSLTTPHSTTKIESKSCIMDSLYKKISKMQVSARGYPQMTFNISPDGTYRGIPGEPAHNFCMTYSSLMRLRRYRNFWDLVRPINENTENTAAELSKLLTLFWRQTTTWYSNGQEGFQPVCHVLIPIVIILDGFAATVNLPIVIVASSLSDLVPSDEMDCWYSEHRSAIKSYQPIQLDMSGDKEFLALLTLDACKIKGYFQAPLIENTHPHRVTIPSILAFKVDIPKRDVCNESSFWIIPGHYDNAILPTNISSHMQCNFNIAEVPTINGDYVKQFYSTFSTFLRYRNNYVSPVAKRTVTNSGDNTTTNPIKHMKYYSTLNPTDKGSYDSNNNFIDDSINLSSNLNNIHIKDVIPKQNDEHLKTLTDEIEKLTRQMSTLSSVVLQKHKEPVGPIPIDDRTPFPLKSKVDITSSSSTSEFYYDDSTDSQKWLLVTGIYDHKYTYDLIGLKLTIGGIVVEFSEGLSMAVDAGIPIVGPQAPKRKNINPQTHKSDYSGNNYDDSSYPNLSSAQTKSKKTESLCFDPNNIGEGINILIKAVVKVIPTWIKGQQINHIHGRAILEYFLDHCFDLSNTDSKAAHQLLTDLKTVHTNPYSWNIALAALMIKYYSEAAKTSSQNKFTGYVQKLDESFESYVRTMLKLGESPFGLKPVYAAQTIVGNAVTCKYVRNLRTLWAQYKPTHWSSWEQMSFELTQTIVPIGIEEWSMTTPVQYPDYPEKGKEYSRHGMSKKSPVPESASSSANASEKSKKKGGAKHCDICNMKNHNTDEHTVQKKSREDKKGSPAACYTCGSKEHMKPDCPENNAGKNVLAIEADSTKSTAKSAKDDKAQPSKGSLSKGKQSLSKDGTPD